MLRLAKGVLIPAALLIIWELGWHISGYESLSRPFDIALALYAGLLDGSVPRLTWQTLKAAMFGFAVASALGVLGGIALGLAWSAERVVRPVIDLLRPIPSVALIPLAMLIFGFGVRMEASIVAFACLWPVLIITITAVRSIEPSLIELSRTLEMKPLQRMIRIIVPAALGRISVGLQLALAISLVVAVTVEIVISPQGLGYGMMSAQQSLRFDVMYALLVWTGFVGWALSRAGQWFVGRCSPGRRASREGAPA